MSKDISKDLKNLFSDILSNSSYTLDDFMAHIILVALEMNNGNRNQTAKQLRIQIKTFRAKLRMIEGMGYFVPPSKLGRSRKELDDE